jgi:hypothetical protein
MDRLKHEDCPHLSKAQWEGLRRLCEMIGGEAVHHLLTVSPKELQTSTAKNFLKAEKLERDIRNSHVEALKREHESAMIELSNTLNENTANPAEEQAQQPPPSLPRPQPLKLEVSKYKGEERESLLRWFVELETAITARLINTESTATAFAISCLGGRAKQWALGMRLANPDCFPSYLAFKKALRETFEPPKNEFRARSQFLQIKQDKKDLHAYVQEVRYLVSCIVSEPVDNATQVSVFLNGLKDGPVRRQLFRDFPSTLEEAITIALQEEFSARQAKRDTAVGTRIPHSDRNDPTPMDCSTVFVAKPDSRSSNARPQKDKSNIECRRCGKKGHYASECRAAAPMARSEQASRGRTPRPAQSKNVRSQ